MPSIQFEKSLLRVRLRHRLLKIKPAAKKIKSRKIVDHLLAMDIFRKSKNVFAYVSLPAEVQTDRLILKMIAAKKNVYVPHITKKQRHIHIFKIYDPAKDLRKGMFGILQPRPLKVRKGNPVKLDLIIVPGLGFDKNGMRLGRGGGFFDRFLKKTQKAYKIGLAFREQVVNKIPKEAHDIPVDRLITA